MNHSDRGKSSLLIELGGSKVPRIPLRFILLHSADGERVIEQIRVNPFKFADQLHMLGHLATFGNQTGSAKFITFLLTQHPLGYTRTVISASTYSCHFE